MASPPPPTATITLAGIVEEWNTRCTSSEPPSCASELALRDAGRAAHRLVLVDPDGGRAYRCGTDCCTLDAGRAHVVTGTVDAASGQLHVASICQLPP